MGIANRNKSNHSNMFVSVKDATILLPILKNRLPKSCHVYNMAMRQSKFSSEMNFYVLGGDIHDNSWIMATFFREDCGMDINISHPNSKEKLGEMKEALITTELISWDKPYIFAALDRDISSMIRDICVDIKGNNTCMNPCIMYYADPSVCLGMNLKHIIDNAENVEVKRLESFTGGEFLFRTWKFATTGSLEYIHKILQRNDSTGVFVDGKLVSAIALAGSGLMSMLHTEDKFRKRGYGKLCMQNHMKTLSANGLIPCCTVEYHNEASNSFQRSVGLQFSHYADFISYSSNSF